jgi:putative peptidoglycan lipid II flippase
MSQMLKSSGAMAAATMVSRVLGMVREIVYAGFMGTSWVASAFLLAFQIPNLFRRLLGEGALTAAFIPIFKEKEKLEGDQVMWRAANAVISALVIFACIVVAAGLVAVSILLAIGGQADNGATRFTGKTLLMLQLLRLMLPYLLLVCLAAVFMGMLNARGHFFIPSLGAATLNLVMIASVLWLAPHLGREVHEQIFALAIGVLAAGVAQAAFQLPSLRREGFRYQWVTPWNDDTVRRVVKQMLPATVGVAAFQINVVLTQGLSFWVGDYIVASFQYAVRLMELPQGVFGLSLATYLLPALSGLAAEKKYPDFRATLVQGLEYLVFINTLAAALLMALAEPIVRLIFERRAFDSYSTQQVAFALVCLAPGLVAFSAVNILARAFYALGDTQTPMKISIGCFALNLLFALLLIIPFQQGGLGLANALTSIFNATLLLYALRKKMGRLELKALSKDFLSVCGAAVLSGAAAFGGYKFWQRQFGHDALVFKLGEVFIPMTIATLIYFGLANWLNIKAAKELLDLAKEKLKRRRA